MEEDVRNIINNKSEEIHSPQSQPNGRDPAQPPSPEPDLDEVKDRHRDLSEEVARLTELKRKVVAGELEALLFEAELREVADKYKKSKGTTVSKLAAAVEQRLRPPMSLEGAEAWLAEGRTQRDEVLQIAETGGLLWHDADRQAFATIQRGGHRETWNVRSRDYKLYLVAEYRRRHGRVPAGQAIHEALDAIEAAALDGAEHEAFVRVAGDDLKSPEKIYLDLVDESRSVVEIDADGWQIISNPPVHFFRPKGLRGLPSPKRSNVGAGIRKLRALVNVTGDAFILYVSWMFACLWPSGPYTILVLTGEHGTAKTTAAEVARESTDPGKVKIAGPPRNEENMIISARNRRVMVYDNFSKMPGWLADALCRMATGAGLETRALYTDNDQNLIAVERPVVITAIPEFVASRADFADRTLCLVLEPIPEDQRRTEEEIWAAFEVAAPEILGSLLAGVSLALRERRRIAAAMKQKPRMADFAALAEAAAPAFGWTAADFRRAYKGNQQEAVDRVLEADPVAEAINEFARQAYGWGERTWEGTMTALLEEIGRLVAEETRRERSWPKDATRLSGRLRRAAPALRTKGITMKFVRKHDDPLPDGRRPVRRIVKMRVEAEASG
jgi:hypothetical protein